MRNDLEYVLEQQIPIYRAQRSNEYDGIADLLQDALDDIEYWKNEHHKLLAICKREGVPL